MSVQQAPLRVCKDLRSLVVLRAIRVFQRYAAARPHLNVLEEYVQQMVMDYAEQNEVGEPLSLVDTIHRLEQDHEHHALSPATQTDFLLLDYWEVAYAPLLHARMKDWVLFNGFRPITGKEFDAFFSPLLEAPHLIGIEFVDTYHDQTRVDHRELYSAQQNTSHCEDDSSIETWRIKRNVQNAVSERQWRALGFDAVMPYYEFQAVLSRWIIEIEEVYDHPSIYASHIGAFLRAMLAWFEKSDENLPRVHRYFSVGELGGEQAMWDQWQTVFTDEYIAASIRAYPQRRRLVQHLLDRVTQERHVASEVWASLRAMERPKAKDIRSSLRLLSKTYAHQLFQSH